jgi:hypothetical protein
MEKKNPSKNSIKKPYFEGKKKFLNWWRKNPKKIPF